MSYDCYCDYDPPLFFWKRKPRARKPHRCGECGGPIKPGELYERVTGKWPATCYGVDVMLTCERCHDIRQWVTNNLPCFCWLYGSMLDDAQEAVTEAAYAAGEEVAGLRFGFLRRLVLLRRHNKLAKQTS